MPLLILNFFWILVLAVLSGHSRARGAGPMEGGRSPRLGTNLWASGRILHFKAPLNAYARAQVGQLGTNVTFISAVLALPPEFETTSVVPLLIVCSSSGSPSIRQVNGYTNAALSEGWAVLAADGPAVPANRDTVLWNWAAVSSALDYLQTAEPRSRLWPLALGGFSGGSKRGACVAAAAIESRRQVRGVFAGGCNEPAATSGMRLFKGGATFLNTPFFLSNGNEDGIASPASGAAVKAAMERAGFTRVRAETYSGGHRLDEEQLRLALRWFGGPPVAPMSPGATVTPGSGSR